MMQLAIAGIVAVLATTVLVDSVLGWLANRQASRGEHGSAGNYFRAATYVLMTGGVLLYICVMALAWGVIADA